MNMPSGRDAVETAIESTLSDAHRTTPAAPSTIARIAAFVVLVAVVPVLLVAALAVLLTSRGPLFYHSIRLGRNGKPFAMLKFRTMYTDPDRHLAALVQESRNVMIDDPRVTPVGRILRTVHLDELPQLINFMRGEMNIGSRPMLSR